jgi:hypothetical protein
MTFYIGIAGQMKTGKSSLAEVLQALYKVEVLSFAEPLRWEVAQAFYHKQEKSNARYLWSVLEEEDKELCRPLLQAWGQAKRDLVDEDYWVSRLRTFVERKGLDVVIIDDVRHVNEAKFIIDNGGMMFWLTASHEVLLERGWNPDNANHASEKHDDLMQYLSEQIPTNRVFGMDTSGRSNWGMYLEAERLLNEKGFDFSNFMELKYNG